MSILNMLFVYIHTKSYVGEENVPGLLYVYVLFLFVSSADFL